MPVKKIRELPEGHPFKRARAYFGGKLPGSSATNSEPGVSSSNPPSAEQLRLHRLNEQGLQKEFPQPESTSLPNIESN